MGSVGLTAYVAGGDAIVKVLDEPERQLCLLRRQLCVFRSCSLSGLECRGWEIAEMEAEAEAKAHRRGREPASRLSKNANRNPARIAVSGLGVRVWGSSCSSSTLEYLESCEPLSPKPPTATLTYGALFRGSGGPRNVYRMPYTLYPQPLTLNP